MKTTTIVVALIAASTAHAEPRQIPDPTLTPGLALDGITSDKLCPIVALPQRSISTATRRRVFEQYKVTDCVVSGSVPDGPPTCGALYELDHLIPHSLGGADDIKNLWPERLDGPCNAKHKDKLEIAAHKEFCAGRLTLDAARALFTNDWRIAYRARFGACGN